MIVLLTQLIARVPPCMAVLWWLVPSRASSLVLRHIAIWSHSFPSLPALCGWMLRPEVIINIICIRIALACIGFILARAWSPLLQVEIGKRMKKSWSSLSSSTISPSSSELAMLLGSSESDNDSFANSIDRSCAASQGRVVSSHATSLSGLIAFSAQAAVPLPLELRRRLRASLHCGRHGADCRRCRGPRLLR